MAKILVLHGPNLNLLGLREPKLYGSMTLNDLNQQILLLAAQLKEQVEIVQSNSESHLIERIHLCCSDATDFIIFNPAAWTHTSIALRDALLAVEKPFIEVHLSNVSRREPFRQISYFSDIAIGTISGFGMQSYLLAMQCAHDYVTHHLIKKTQEH